MLATELNSQDLAVTSDEFERRIGYALWTSPVAVMISEVEDGLIHAVNDAFCRLFGFTREQLVGRHSTDLGMWASAEDRRRALAPVDEGSWLSHTAAHFRTATGEERTVLRAMTEVTIEGRRLMATQFVDLTESLRTEARLRLLNRVARLGYEARSVDAVLGGTLEAIHALFPDLRVGYGAFESESVVVMAASVEPDGMPRQSGLRVDIGVAPEYARAIARGTPVLISDVRTDERIRPLTGVLEDFLVGAFLDVPVRRNDQTVGILFLDSAVPHHWSEHEVTTMEEVAALLALSMFRASAEEELRREREMLQTMMDNVPDFLYVKDVHSRFTRVNRAGAAFLGCLDPADLIGKTDFDFFPERLARRFYADEQAVIASGKATFNRLEPQDDAESIWTLTTTVPVKDANGNVVGLVGAARDVSERHRMEVALRASEARQRALLEAVPDVVLRYDRDGVYLDMRLNAASPHWAPPESRIGRRVSEFVPEPVAARIIGAIREALDTGRVVTVEYELDRGGNRIAIEMRVAPSGESEVVAIARDVTERKILEERLAHDATHDALTGLPNRALFINRLDEALRRPHDEHAPVAVFFVDLDDFKEVNDRHGHAAGDQLLIAIGDRLRQSVRACDTVARIGGDEFAVLVDGMADADEVETIARRIADRIGRPVRLGNTAVRAAASIGAGVGLPGDKPAAELLDAADRAMYAAKRDGKARHAVISIGDDCGTCARKLSTAPAQGRSRWVDDHRSRGLIPLAPRRSMPTCPVRRGSVRRRRVG